MRCYYPYSQPDAISAEEQLHDATGLPLTRIAQGDSLLTAADLAALPVRGQELLAAHIGKPICGLSKITLFADEVTYRPSASFVAQQAAVLVVGALIARTAGYPSGPRHIEYDALYSPYDDMTTFRAPREDCDCQTRPEVIRQVRSIRQSQR